MDQNLEIKMQAENIVNKGIQQLVYKYNAYAPIVSAFRIVYGDFVPTMGVDKYCRLVINPKFVVENETKIVGVLVHEVLHVFMGHTSDRSKLEYTENNKRNELINIAEDCAINQFIKEPLPEGCITPEEIAKLVGKQVAYWDNNDNNFVKRFETAEYYFDVLLEHAKNNEKGEGEGEEGEEGNSLSSSPLANDLANALSKKVQDALDKMGIEHVSGEEVNDKVMDTAKNIMKGQGCGSSELAEFAKKMLEPKIDWRPLLQATIRNAEKKVWNIHARQTFKRVSRRSKVVLMPKKYGHKISVALSFDTSGSIDRDMVNQFLSEIQNCMKYSEIKECALWNTENYWYGTPEELLSKIEKVFQSGGTDERCMGEAEKHVKADLYIHFSDGGHGEDFGFEHPQKNIEIIWDGNDINRIRNF